MILVKLLFSFHYCEVLSTCKKVASNSSLGRVVRVCADDAPENRMIILSTPIDSLTSREFPKAVEAVDLGD